MPCMKQASGLLGTPFGSSPVKTVLWRRKQGPTPGVEPRISVLPGRCSTVELRRAPGVSRRSVPDLNPPTTVLPMPTAEQEGAKGYPRELVSRLGSPIVEEKTRPCTGNRTRISVLPGRYSTVELRSAPGVSWRSVPDLNPPTTVSLRLHSEF